MTLLEIGVDAFEKKPELPGNGEQQGKTDPWYHGKLKQSDSNTPVGRLV
ncbi:MAG: hypothetical protein V2I35_09690 [Desulfocapsaceae bacterium]|jgi:hypothetical protein|nr:hypothetical protein [Desulfocapsaceae bacterium]